MSRRLLRTGLALAVGLAALGSCADIPETGPITRVGGEVEPEEELINFAPAGPTPGMSPTKIVTEFFLAMQAYPPSTAAAKQYLTREAASAWDPSHRTVVYEGIEPTPTGQTVTLDIQRQATLSWRGAYQAIGRAEPPERLEFRLRQENGEWRITNPTDTLYVDDDFFSRYFQPFSLYFIAPSADALVPYPIYLPTGEQLATSLVQGLLAGLPAQRSQPPLTAVPQETPVDVSVSITTDGIAEIRLNGPLLNLDEQQRELLSAQLVWTLAQVSGVNSVRILVEGARWEIPGVPAVQNVQLWRDLDPANVPARAQLFALDGSGRLVEVVETVDPDSSLVGDPRATRLEGSLWGFRPQGIRSFDVGLQLGSVLGVTTDGDRLVTGPLYSSRGRPPQQVYDDGTDLSEPTATRAGEWLVVDRRARSSHLLVVGGEGKVREVPFGPLRHTRVQSLTLSPDGTRFAAITQPLEGAGRSEPRLLVGQVRFEPDGLSIAGVDGARGLLSTSDAFRDIRSVGWVDATTLGLLGDNGTGVAPYTVRIDGSQLVNEWILPPELGVPVSLEPSTAPEGGIYIRNARGQLWFEADGLWLPVGTGRLVAATFPG